MKKALNLLLLLALVPSLFSLLPRLEAERPGPVVLVMDGKALEEEARTRGESFLEAFRRYQAQGVFGVALYENTVRDWVDQGALLLKRGLELKEEGLPARPGWFYLKGEEWLLKELRTAYTLPTHEVPGYLGFPLDPSFLPALYDPRRAQALKAAGAFLVYRPLNHPLRVLEEGLLPKEADAVVFTGTEALGFPHRLEEAKALLRVPVAWIEGTPQEGLNAFKANGVLRLFSLKAEWLLSLKPKEAADKFVLAARERGHQLLYLRPYPYPEDTQALIARIKEELSASRIPLGAPKPRDFTPSPLRHVAWLGVLSGLGLLALGLPVHGTLVAGLLLLFALGYARGQGGALLAALVFPTLGFLGPRNGVWMWLRSLGYALAGAVFLSALGSTPEALLGLTPFKGVSLTLLIPPLLVLYSLLPQDFKGALSRLFNHPLRLGEVGLGVLGLALLALALLRRGNDAPVVPEWELKLRAILQEAMVRPRFKEIFGHAVFLLALLLPWPRWVQNALLVVAAVGMASILNTFSHFHTPLLISLFRVLNGALFGLLLGAVGVILGRRLIRWWWG